MHCDGYGFLPDIYEASILTTQKFSSRSESARQRTIHASRIGCLVSFNFRPPLSTASTVGLQLRPHGNSQHRFNSTIPNITPSTPAAGADYGPLPTADLVYDVAQNTQESVNGTVAQAPRYLGFLYEYGVDFGWGPTSIVQWCFEHIHIVAGTPFWASIMLMAVAIRVGTFPLVMTASNTSCKQQAVKPLIDPLMEKMRAAAHTGNQMEAQQARAEVSRIYKDNDIKIWKAFVPFLQMPLAYGSWRLCWKMADCHVPGLDTAGFLWIHNLTISDPYFILPILAGSFQHLAARVRQVNSSD